MVRRHSFVCGSGFDFRAVLEGHADVVLAVDCHKAFGTGTVIGTETGKITVSFNGAEKKFQFPGAFMQGFLKKQK